MDRKSVLAALAGPGVTLHLYAAAMQALERAYQSIDSLFLQASNLCPPDLPPYTPRIPSIDHDLIALGVPHDTSGAHRLAAPRTEAAYLGMRYVVEGAQLGARVIHGHLHRAFGNELSHFGSFWMPNSALQNSWPGVLKSLARLESRESLAAAARGARLTFRHMESHLAVSEEGIR